jgi:transcriptional regulator with XRE-family HTH domain
MPEETAAQRKARKVRAGAWLEAERLKRGLTQAALADALGLPSQNRISNYENGVYEIKAWIAPDIARVLDLPEREVWRGLEIPLPKDSRGSSRRAPSTLDAIMADPNLDEETRAHFANQYRILTSLTEHRRQVESPGAALPPEEATLAGVDPDPDAADPEDNPGEVRAPARKRRALQ